MGDVRTAKRFLRKIREEQGEIRILEGKREEIRLSLLPPGIRYDRERVQASPMDALPERVARMCEIDEEIASHLRELNRRRARAMGMIRRIEKSTYRLVLETYYLALKEDGRAMRWEDVARVTGYSEQAVKWTHGRALEKFGEVMDEKPGDENF